MKTIQIWQTSETPKTDKPLATVQVSDEEAMPLLRLLASQSIGYRVAS